MAAGGRLFLIGFAVAMVVLFQEAAATEYTVGDDMGWTGPPNITPNYYNDWAANKTFKGGDSLKFVFNGTHTMNNVTKEEYDNCTKDLGIVFSGSNGQEISFNLPSDASGMHYFICTVDSHCEGGQKLAINVTSSLTTTSTTTDDESSSASLSLTFGALFTVLYTASAFLLFN